MMKDRILVLDDDEETLELVSVFLQNEGYEVFTCDHLYKDLTEVAVLSPRAMIVDVFMGDKY
jgi:DNA-binding response OmpR family regulator